MSDKTIVPVPLQPIGIDLSVNEILYSLITNLSWLDNGHGRAYRKLEFSGDKQIYLPEVYAGNSTYKGVQLNNRPDMDIQSTCYFIVGNQTYSEFTELEYNKLDYRLSIVFNGDLERINAALLTTDKFVENLIQDVRGVLTRNLVVSNSLYIKNMSVTSNYNEVYSEFSSLQDNEQMLAPHFHFRFDLDVTINESCADSFDRCIAITNNITSEEKLDCLLPTYDFSLDNTFNSLTGVQVTDLTDRLCGGGGGQVNVSNSDNSYSVVVDCGNDLDLPDISFIINSDPFTYPSVKDLPFLIQNTNSQQVGGGDWTGWEVDDTELSMNGQDFVLIPAEQPYNASIKNTDNNNVGTVNGNDFIIADSTISINGVDMSDTPAEVDLDLNVVDGDDNPVGSKVGNNWVVISTPQTVRGYVKAQKLGVVASFADYDYAWHLANGTYEYPEVGGTIPLREDWYNFEAGHENEFGNLKRFTGITGGYQDENDLLYYDVNGVATTEALAFPTDMCICHYSYYMFRRRRVGLMNWVNNLNYAHNTASWGGYNDWRVSHKGETAMLCRYNITSGTPLNVSPFVIGNYNGVTVFNCNTYLSDTTRAWVLDQLGRDSFQNKVNNYAVIFIRDWEGL